MVVGGLDGASKVLMYVQNCAKGTRCLIVPKKRVCGGGGSSYSYVAKYCHNHQISAPPNDVDNNRILGN